MKVETAVKNGTKKCVEKKSSKINEKGHKK